jgi:hypothetical protein
MQRVWQKVRVIVYTAIVIAVAEAIAVGVAFERGFAADYKAERAANAASRAEEQKVWAYLTAPIDSHGTSRAQVIDAAVAQAQAAKH